VLRRLCSTCQHFEEIDPCDWKKGSPIGGNALAVRHGWGSGGHCDSMRTPGDKAAFAACRRLVVERLPDLTSSRNPHGPPG